ncbi:MAG TPA: hypothetical protein VLM79_24795 [Kofleriaceae bacterium]|nr:hypothetical protein [Kofleriaceae bacterium]
MTSLTTAPTTANDVRSIEPVRHGAYLCFAAPHSARELGPAVRTLAQRLGLRNEYEPGSDHPREAIAYLRRTEVTPAQIADEVLARATAVVHVAAPTADPVEQVVAELGRLLGPEAAPRVLGGVVRPMMYTGGAMHNFAYAHRLLQQPGADAPHAFLVPMSKTEAWWRKPWMERHTYFLPRYDDTGRMVHEGHALASAAGIPALMRRTYKHPSPPAPAGAYDFVTYFECADDAVPVFHEVCAALRDVAKNPEWAFVREGPTWHGRRVATWEAMFD